MLAIALSLEIVFGASVEQVRIAAQLERVECELRRVDASGLDPALRAARERNLHILHGYRLRGVFPHNHDLPGRVPVFVDAHGTACAVAYLIIQSGHRELAERI